MRLRRIKSMQKWTEW